MSLRITGAEKSFLGGLGAGIVTFAGQLQVGGKLDAKTVGWSIGAWVATHLFVYYTTNTAVANAPAELGKVAAEAETPTLPPTAPAA